ncbi:TetR/AcrR family transcriptional regulator [Alkalihalobacillus trypoxylicola]|nr:TetR/AcrR family transcriptional regulator [Alkalihalobacillus trypoxylicola]
MKKLTRVEELERTRKRILDVAEDLFMEKGFRAVSTREIAQHAKVTQPTLYHHFKDKESLYMVMLERFVLSIQKKLKQVSKDDMAKAIEEMLIILSIEHPSSIMLMMHDISLELSEENKYKIYSIWRQTYLEPFMDLFERNEKKHLRKQITPEQAARFCLFTLGQAMLSKGNPESLKEQFKTHVDIILYGTIEN